MTARHVLAGLMMGLAPVLTTAATITLNQGANITEAIECATQGDTIQLNPGVYPAQNTTQYYDPNFSIGIGKRINIVGLGASPGDVILRGAATSNYTVNFTQYTMPQENCVVGAGQTNLTPSNSTLQNLTIDTGKGGIAIFNPSLRFADITIKDVVIQTDAGGSTFGVLLQNTDRIVLDNVTVTSNQTGFMVINTTDSLIMNSTVTGTGTNAGGANVGAATLAVIGGSSNRIVGSTFGSPKANPAVDSGYSVNTGNVVFYNSVANRFERNVVQGHRDDGVDFSALNNPNDVGTMKATDNYAGKNTVVSTGFAAGRTEGSGMWANCGSDSTWFYANDSRGSTECGTCVWLSSSNMVLANNLHDNRLTGVFVSGGAEAPPLCPVEAFRTKPASNFIRNNKVSFNRNDQIVVRNADTNDISLNFISPRESIDGPLQSCNPANTFCQAAISLETDASAASSTDFRVAANLSHENNRGLWGDDGKINGLQFFGNRIIASTLNRFVQAAPLNVDAGQSLGGNFWTQHTALGNPSTSTPFSAIFDSTSNTSGKIVDRYPYQTEDLGRGYGVTVFEPRAGLAAAQGTPRTVRWYSPGCSYVDIALDGTTDLATSAPNTGYAVVMIPGSASVGSHFMRVRCKNSAGTVRAQADSSAFNVTGSALQLLSPGRDDVVNAGTPFYVAWKKTSGITSVDVQFSANGGSTFTTLASAVTGTFARVTIPDGTASTAYGVIRVVSGANSDTTDGVFAVRGTSGAGFSNVPAGRKFIMGQMERLEWASPQNSRLVTITATVGATTRTVANNLPDRGFFDWIVDDLGAGTVTLSVTFKQTNGSQIGSPSANSAGATLYPTTITFGATPAIAPGGSGSLAASSNSGTAVTFTTLTPSICTVSGTSVQAVAAGVCIIAATAPADGTHAASPQVTLAFNIGTAQTITFNAPSLVAVDGTANLVATASSGLPVGFRSLTGTVCGVAGSVVTGISTGTCTVEATQDGNSSFSAAPPVTRNFPVVINTAIPRLVNIATRGRVGTGANVLIAGFIIGGDKPKKVLVTARGPSVAVLPSEVPLLMADPSVVLYSGANPIDSNDDWQQKGNWPEIPQTMRPGNAKDAAILTTLAPGAYTAIVSGVNNTEGLAIVEVFEVDLPEVPLINIATRGRVGTVSNQMIAGFIIQGDAPKTVLVTARGQSTAVLPSEVPLLMADPYLKIYSGANVIYENDDWQGNITTADGWGSPLPFTSIPLTQRPGHAKDAAVMVTLPPGPYTAIVSGVNNGEGIGIVEVFAQ